MGPGPMKGDRIRRHEADDEELAIQLIGGRPQTVDPGKLGVEPGGTRRARSSSAGDSRAEV